MPDGKMSTRDYLIQIYERVENIKNEQAELKGRIEKIENELVNVKIKVYVVAGIISFIVSISSLLLKLFLRL
jgi:hypothetical protein